jgi:hypothetical protein
VLPETGNYLFSVTRIFFFFCYLPSCGKRRSFGLPVSEGRPLQRAGLSFFPGLTAHVASLYSIPVTLTFEEATGKNVLLLPMGSSTDAAHSVNGM